MTTPTERLHVRGLRDGITEADLVALFGKFRNCSVQEVFLPQPQSWKKGFGIVRLECSKDIALSAVKALNGTLWNGCKLQLGWAKEWYQDRMARVSHQLDAQQQSTFETAKLAEGELAVVRTVPKFGDDMLVVRKARFLRKIRTSPEPAVHFLGKWFCKRQSKLQQSMEGNFRPLRFACKTLFEEEALQSLQEQDLVELSAPATSKLKTKLGLVIGEDMKKGNSTSTYVAKSGGGVRKGFGTLLHAKVPRSLSAPAPPVIEASDGAFSVPEVEETISAEGLLEDRLRTLRVLNSVISAPPVVPAPTPTLAAKRSTSISAASSVVVPTAIASLVADPTAFATSNTADLPSFTNLSELKTIFHRQVSARFLFRFFFTD